MRRCYEIAPPRVQRYLQAEIEFVRERLGPGDRVLELGCGYGRVLDALVKEPVELAGIDTALESLSLAKDAAPGSADRRLARMNAVQLAFSDKSFDLVFCIQNGVCAFNVDQAALLDEALRVLRPGGCVLLSSYAASFWKHRLDWFRRQAAAGLLGEIDEEATGNGVIVCRDGFRAGSMDEEGFAALASGRGVGAEITELDGSSLFCIVHK